MSHNGNNSIYNNVKISFNNHILNADSQLKTNNNTKSKVKEESNLTQSIVDINTIFLYRSYPWIQTDHQHIVSLILIQWQLRFLTLLSCTHKKACLLPLDQMSQYIQIIVRTLQIINHRRSILSNIP
jgi:hypothetical protein